MLYYSYYLVYLDDGSVVCLRYTEVLGVQVHQLHLVVRHLLLVRGLEHERHSVRVVLKIYIFKGMKKKFKKGKKKWKKKMDKLKTLTSHCPRYPMQN